MRVRLIITVTAIVALITAVSVGGAVAGGGYRTYTTCGIGHDSSCSLGDAFGGIFKARNGKKTHYRLCVNPPQGLSKKCKKLKTNRKGKDFASVYRWYGGNLQFGTYKFTWKKGGHKIDRDAMSLHSEGV